MCGCLMSHLRHWEYLKPLKTGVFRGGNCVLKHPDKEIIWKGCGLNSFSIKFY